MFANVSFRLPRIFDADFFYQFAKREGMEKAGRGAGDVY